MEIRLKSTVRSIGRAEALRIARASLAWCKKEFGVNNRKQYELTYALVKGSEDECGEYDAEENKIYIYWSSLDNVEEIIKTCIHEWTHYKQPILTQYHKYKGGYNRHPFEKEANRNEVQYYKSCWDAIRLKINK
jgi:hypothetical protein